jgi:protein-S-isoprenylcysteine O-methyltransferase Ste14
VLFADGVVVAGYLVFIFVLRENRYASRIVEVEVGQKLVTSGPYAVVRHPMYAAAALIYTATPLALGSYWGMAMCPGVVGFLVARILNEEEVLVRGLDGYADYMWTTRYRLLPGVW